MTPGLGRINHVGQDIDRRRDCGCVVGCSKRPAKISLPDRRNDHPVCGRRRCRSDRPIHRGFARRAARTERDRGQPRRRGRHARFRPARSGAARRTHDRFRPVHADRECALSGQGRALRRRFVRIHLPGVRECVHHRGRPDLAVQVREGAVRGSQRQVRRVDLRTLRPRLDPASLCRKPGRRLEGQGAAFAVPRRRRDAAGAAQGRLGLWRAGRVVHSRQRHHQAACRLHRQTPSGVSGCADGARARRHDCGSARPERSLCAERHSRRR